MREDEDVYFLTADLGYGAFEEVQSNFPSRFINVGVAEATMASVAAGMALEGLRPFIYSIAPFVTYRCYEQLCNDVCMHKLPITVVGVGGGYAYGDNGPTHHALMDVAVMSALPHMTVVCPCDPFEAALATKCLAKIEGPAYLRLGRNRERNVHEKTPPFSLGKAIVIRPGADVAFLGAGTMVATALASAARLEERTGLSVRVVSFHTVKPIDREMVRTCAQESKCIVTFEEHGPAGGFGDIIARELVSEGRFNTPLKIFSTREGFGELTGSQEYLRVQDGLDEQTITRVLEDWLKKDLRLC
jgi:transketolase